MTDRNVWYRIRREMFEHLMEEVSVRWGKEPPDLRSYRRAYDQETRKRWSVSDRDALMAAAEKHRLILVGDFHALQQSQKAQLRLLKLFFRKGLRFRLGVECLHARHQADLERFLSGKITERLFLRRVRWASQWGFPWDHYRPLFEWARKNEVEVVALNGGRKGLRDRERFAARRILELDGREETRWVVLYGDLHLSRNRLPAELKREGLPRPLRIFQNVEEAAFRLMKRGQEGAELIKYGSSSFALLSVPPWVKWQNYLLWLDQKMDAELDEEAGDVTDSVAGMVGWLAREFKLEVSSSALTVYTAGDPDLWKRIKQSVPPKQRPWIEMMIEEGRSFYLSRAGWGYLARATVNHAASLAAQFLHDQVSESSSRISFRFPRDFRQVIWIETVAYFATKIINPQRKSDTLHDMRVSLSSRQGNDEGKEALRLALSQKMLERMNPHQSPLTPLRPKHKSSWIAAAHLLGALAGERLYAGFQNRKLPLRDLQKLLKEPLDSDDFDLIYREVMGMIERLPAPFRSKREKL